NQTPDVHEQIAELLAALRRLQDVEVAVELRVLSVADDFCGSLGLDADAFAPGDKEGAPKVTFLNEAQAFMLMEAVQGDKHTNVMQAPKLTMFNGQRLTLTVLDRQFFVTGVEVKWDGRHVLAVPKNEPHETGLKMTLQPVVSGDGKFVRLRLSGTMSTLTEDPVPLSPISNMIYPEPCSGPGAKPVLFTQFIQLPKLFKLQV